METLVIALVPDEPLYSRMREMMLRYSEELSSVRALRIPPHITLVNRFHTDRREQLIGALREQCETLGPVQVTFEGIDKFRSPHLLYLKVRLTPELQALHESTLETAMLHGRPIRKEREEGLSAEQQELADRYGRFHVRQFYVPHLTLAGSDVDERKFSAFPPAPMALSSTFTHVAVLRKSDAWEIVCRIPLGQDHTQA